MLFLVKLFFFDDGTSAQKEERSDPSSDENDSDSSESVDKPVERTRKASSAQPLNPSTSAWVDPDDERLRVSIASDKRLRKLRLAESEDVITGNEYENRLRRQ